MSNQQIDVRCADNIRALSAAMVEAAKSGHPGGPMGGADFIHILYSEFLRFDPDNPQWAWRDRFFLDPGHLSAMLYAQLHLVGNYSKEDISNFRQWGSVTPGHPEVDQARGVENTSGPLGQGHAMGAGAALAAKFLAAKFGAWTDHKIYAYISDGGIQEEISQGIGRIAGYLGLNNLIMFFDSNDVQLSTKTDEVTSEDTAKKYEAWGWNVVVIDGHDHDAIRKALQDAQNSDKPTLIEGKTIMGKGCVDADGNSYEGHVELHGKPLGGTGADFTKTLEALGANPEDPFEAYSDVKEYYAQILDRKREEVKAAKQTEQEWRAANAELAKKLDLFLSGDIPEVDFAEVQHKANGASREASSAVLGYLAGKVENLIVASADLANSDKTDGYLKKVKQFGPGTFDANFLHAGVAEFSMAAMANGMALHGGVIPVIGTFFIFSDYQKPAYRLSALMELPVIYLWTHDAFRVGEDGPTHQPIEQEAQLRLLEKLKNHSGKRSMLALRPADAAETTVAWEMALKNTATPTGLIFSRQGIKDLPAEGSRLEVAQQAAKGAYRVKSDADAEVTLIANGSEVATLVDAAELLEKEGIKSNIVSVISEGLFRDQSADYQAEVLGDKPKFGLTAGLPVTLEGLVGLDGKVFGLEHFGYSAPAGVLDDKFGYTGPKVFEQVKAFLGK
ncbi:transketolase family protein [Marinoscillum furvescens]|uniref:transketolase n=1 Tax=Marinoscillum furvescens DSM 4134 TaxID=1122208 RepID=A0A3D9L2V6_MARFU|nr:transketolase [Marinoscillum furvescens]RED97398.1 transketolase [Marinoscillum furvescens DSM 4134]